jgi:hypothetical protein
LANTGSVAGFVVFEGKRDLEEGFEKVQPRLGYPEKGKTCDDSVEGERRAEPSGKS